jgi:hypothetical protein
MKTLNDYFNEFDDKCDTSLYMGGFCDVEFDGSYRLMRYKVWQFIEQMAREIERESVKGFVNMKSRTEVEEIINRIGIRHDEGEPDVLIYMAGLKENWLSEKMKQNLIDDLYQLIKDEVIGEDQTANSCGSVYYADSRNKLIESQRARLDKLFGREKE